MITASRHLRAASDSAPADGELAAEAAAVHILAGDMRGALHLAPRLPEGQPERTELLQAAHALAVGDRVLRRELAVLHLEQANAHRASGLVLDALFQARLSVLHRPSSEGHRLIASVLAEVGKYDLAIRELQKVARGSRGYAEARLELAAVYLESGNAKDAAAVADRLPRGALRDAILSEALRAGGRPEEARQVLSRRIAAATEPSQRADLLAERAQVEQQLRRPAAAEADLREALRAQPGHAGAMLALARSWAQRGERPEEAEAVLRREIAQLDERIGDGPGEAQLHAQRGELLRDLGAAQFRGGDLVGAVDSLTRALARGEPHWPTLEHLGDTYAALGRPREARWAYDQAAALADPAGRERLRGKLGAAGD